MGTSACLFHIWEVSSRGALRLCAAISTCIVGVPDACSLRARRLIKYCLRIVLPSGITDVIIVKDGKVSLYRCDEHFD